MLRAGPGRHQLPAGLAEGVDHRKPAGTAEPPQGRNFLFALGGKNKLSRTLDHR